MSNRKFSHTAACLWVCSWFSDICR